MLIRFLISAFAVAAVVLVSAAVRGAHIACSKDGVVTLDGACWNALDVDEKGSAVLGIWAGVRSRYIADNLNNRAPARSSKDWIEIPSHTTTADVIDYFNLLYKTPANRRIQWEWAYILAAMNARDDDSDDRRALITFLRDQSSLPVSGSIYGVEAPDLITIKTEQGMFDVHLEGVTSEGLSSAQREVAIAFLRGMLFGDRPLLAFLNNREACETSENLRVSLDFRVQLFRGSVLTPAVAVDPYTLICLEDRRVGVSELSSTDREPLDLGRLMIASGLALPDQEIDPKWPKEAKDEVKHMQLLAEEARAKQLYLYGAGRIPVIDEIIATGGHHASTSSR